jgi:hypothetical protein
MPQRTIVAAMMLARRHVKAMNLRGLCVSAVTFLCCGFLLSLLLTQPCIAHDSKHPEFDSWCRGLKNPNFKYAVIQDLGCCSARDCQETEADIRNGHWWARVGKPHIEYGELKSASDFQYPPYEVTTWELTEWKEVPTEAILKVSNPTGSPVICHSTRYEIWCFVPDNQY